MERKKVKTYLDKCITPEDKICLPIMDKNGYAYHSEQVMFYADYNPYDKAKEVVNYRKFVKLWYLGLLGIILGITALCCVCWFCIKGCNELNIALTCVFAGCSPLVFVGYIGYRLDHYRTNDLNDYLVEHSWIGQKIIELNKIEKEKYDLITREANEKEKAKRVECARRILEDKSPEELVRFLEIYADKKDTSILDLYDDDLG